MLLAKDTERTARLRENKRRYRQRQKEYTDDLEKRLRELQQRGIQATVEVQAAARIVAEENCHLRSLLYELGMTDDAVSAWVRSRMGSKNTSDSGSQGQGSSKGVASSACRGEQNHSQPQKQCSEYRKSRSNPPQYLTADKMVSPKEIPQENPYGTGVAANPSPEANDTDSNSRLGKPAPDKASSSHSTDPLRENSGTTEERPRQQVSSPCKLLSRLTTDSACDAPQAFASSDDELGPLPTQDGVPCSTAYRLLKRHATSEEKIDALARVLEEGCAPDRKGGCNIKHKIVAEALVDMCL